MAPWHALHVQLRSNDVKYGLRERHPALPWYVASMAFLLTVIVLGFIAVFVPWAQVDIAVGRRAMAHPFVTCIINTFSTVHEETCLDNDFIVGPAGAPVTGGDPTCEAFVLTTIGCVFSSVIGGLFLLIAMFFFIYRIWSRPLCFAITIICLLCLVLFTCICAWVLWIFYSERTCIPNSIFPVHGYSYGFCCYVAASWAALISIVCAVIGYLKLKNYKPLSDEDVDLLYENPEYPQYPFYAVTEAPTPVPEAQLIYVAQRPF